MSLARTSEACAIATVAAAGITLILTSYAFRVARVGRIASSRLDSERGTMLLGRFPIEAFHWFAKGVGVTVARTGVSPDALTLLSLAISLFTVPLAGTGHFEAAGGCLLFGSVFDALDGVVARAQKRASDAGEMLDAVVDRYADALCLVGLAYYYRDSAVAFGIVQGAILGSFMVSYVRAKGESFQLSLSGGLMRRPERITYLGGALLFGPMLSSWLVPGDARRPVTLGIVLLLALVTNLVALQLLRAARTQIRVRDAGADR